MWLYCSVTTTPTGKGCSGLLQKRHYTLLEGLELSQKCNVNDLTLDLESWFMAAGIKASFLGMKHPSNPIVLKAPSFW